MKTVRSTLSLPNKGNTLLSGMSIWAGQTMAFVRAKAPQGGLLELRLDGPDGESIAIAPVPPGDEWQAVMMPFTAPVADVHDFYVVLVLCTRDT